MYQDSRKKNKSQKIGNNNILKKSNSNLNISESIPPNIKDYLTKKKKIINKITNKKEIVLYKLPKKEENNKRNDRKYKNIIKKIENNLKKRVYFPKCKIFKFYMTYRLLILRIAKGMKKNLNKINFFEKFEIINNEQKIIPKKEINSTSLKIIPEKGEKIYKKIIFYSEKKKNIKINFPLFKKNEKLNLNINNNIEVNNLIMYLKNIKIKDNDSSNFLDEFSSFLEKNNIKICPETKLNLIKK